MTASSRVSNSLLLRAFFVVAIVAYASPFALASGGGYCDDAPCRSFFIPEIINSPNETAFFLSNASYYGPFNYGDDAIDAVNLDEWKRYFNNRIPETQLKALIYKLSLDDVQNLRRALAKRAPLRDNNLAILRAALARYSNKARVLNALSYLVIAKRVEPIATRSVYAGWDTQPKGRVDDRAAPAIIADARRRARRADTFLAQRYRFQIIRLFYYTGQFSAAASYYERVHASFTGENSPKYRSIAAAAGAYYKEKQFGRANYLFSRVFSRFPSLRRTAYESFHPMEDADWRETLSFARTGHEREVLWQLLGLYADGLAAIDQIYRINPKSRLLDLLLVREVNKAEVDWVDRRDSFTDPDSGRQVRRDQAAVGSKRLAALKAIADAARTSRPYLWQLSVGHLLALSGNLQEAERYLSAAEAGAGRDAAVRTQIRMSRLFARVRATTSIDHAAESYFAREFTWLVGNPSASGGYAHDRVEHLETWSREHLRDVYAAGGDDIRAVMLTDSPSGPLYQSIAGVDRIAAFIRAAQSQFDRWLVRTYHYSIDDLQDLRALHSLYAGDFRSALDSFKRAGPPRMLNADPFTIHINDCHDCDAAVAHTAYSTVSFTERLLQLSQRAEGRGEAASEAAFELGNGFYNMSYFGNSRAVYATKNDNLYGAPMTRSMELAERYYLLAFELTTSKEAKTRALFMAAKAEQNRYYLTRKNDSDPQPHTHFRLLRAQFSDTDYYQELVRECGYFVGFVQK